MAIDDLSPAHLRMLRASAITDDVIQARGYRTITSSAELRALGFAPRQCRVPGLLLPLWTPDGGNSLFIYRPDVPREVRAKNGELKAVKYESPEGSGVRLDCPPPCRAALADPGVRLWITEGQKKADSLASHGLCAVDLLGVWSWRGKNELGGVTVLADLDYIALNGREVVLAFDSDVTTKPQVQAALERFGEHLRRKGAAVRVLYLAPAENGTKVGVDDYLAAGHSVAELEALIEAPKPEPKAAAPAVELLEEAPATIRRPLCLIDGQSYAATWLYTRTTVRESLDRGGRLISHNPPLVSTERRLFIARGDGVTFGDGSDKPLAELGLQVHLPEVPPAEKLWSTRGLLAYRRGRRPEPADVFGRVSHIIDRFIDFERSLAEQRTMCEFVACYILSTWLLDAFSVIGFLWPNGDRGSGKTQLLVLICELAYLGQVVQSGGSFASLRDLADYGACLAFDDAESLADPKRSDPDKRTMLLAGNRRGSTVPLKEPTGDRTWATRHVNTFCPRLFSAIRLPDAVLASRSIVVPLIRTLDRQRANSDPLEYDRWPHERKALLDDLWALGLAYLPELSHYDHEVGERCALLGRALEPWRAVLAVALWLEERGVAGLFGRMAGLAADYQRERPDLEEADLTRLVVRALVELTDDAISAISAISAIKRGVTENWNQENGAHSAISAVDAMTGSKTQNQNQQQHYDYSVSMILEKAREAALAEDLDIEWITSRRVGRVLARLRLQQVPRARNRGSRLWRVTRADVERWAVAHAVPIPWLPSLFNGANGANGIMAQSGEELPEGCRPGDEHKVVYL